MSTVRLAAVAILCFLRCGCDGALIDDAGLKCNATAIPPTRVNTTAQLTQLRALMNANTVHAYIVPSEDSHQSEYVSPYDKRREFISGFSGSAGVAVIFNDNSALWTDGRYFLQAADQLDCNWVLMRQGMPGVPGLTDLIIDTLKGVQNAVVAADAALISASAWLDYNKKFAEAGITFINNGALLDRAWNSTGGRPPPTNNDVFVLDTVYSGRSWQDKVKDVQDRIRGKANALVVTDLAEVAWLFNLRGSDIPYNPFFFAYAIVFETGNPKLYLRNSNQRLLSINNHLGCSTTGQCSGNNCAEVLEYDKIYDDILPQQRMWISDQSSYNLYVKANQSNIVNEQSPIQLLKAIKNPTEIDGMRKCHIRDSAAIIEFVAMLEEQVIGGVEWTELNVSAVLETYRMKQDKNKGLSFETIAGFGSNGAVIHYSPAPETNKRVTTESLLLLDSGGQYLDGSTDITRTFHFGTPTDWQKETYTRVLMGAIDLAALSWPANVTLGASIDAVARAPLWNLGLDYRHGTGHGIGMFLSIHEGPGRIAMGYRPKESPIYAGMFFSDEPGYYEDGKFGIRLETTILATKANTMHKFGGDYLTFEPIALVPFEPKLIKMELLNTNQKNWLERYHKKCEQEVGKFLLDNGNTAAYNWLKSRTSPLESSASSQFFTLSMSTLGFSIIMSMICIEFNSARCLA